MKKNETNPGRGVIEYYRNSSKIDRIPGLYPEDILSNPVAQR